ncbi:hypothetical protein ACJX0J_015626, partial [Zea mays]
SIQFSIMHQVPLQIFDRRLFVEALSTWGWTTILKSSEGNDTAFAFFCIEVVYKTPPTKEKKMNLDADKNAEASKIPEQQLNLQHIIGILAYTSIKEKYIQRLR